MGLSAGLFATSQTVRAGAKAQTDALNSSALGLTFDEFSKQVGKGEFVEEGAGYELYAYNTSVGVMYVAFLAYDRDPIATYVEFQFDPPGYSHDKTEQLTRSLVPADARITETYVAPATPSGPTSIRTSRYTSASLGDVYPSGISEFISMRLEQRDDEGLIVVNSLHLVVAEIGQ